MEEEKHHHFFHHHKKDEEPPTGEYGGAVRYSETLGKYEKHEAKKDPEHAHRHKITEVIAATEAVGAGGYAIHEHHEEVKDHREAEEASCEKKHHHLLG
ncbi:hypothetical protein BAE44_0017185 [Dichanthelium oligosanthes]|uniref:Abscisic stress-ripening protein 2 n=1 Tax=Dichanthelium oligosanthes TaxID=888268 RepID=A0A1E5V9H4_9POAL|nr:hypothetical protein BAE44_0017185 [Dichanthelium oligosanthes]